MSFMEWHWCLKIYYWWGTVWCYIQLGLSLVAVQVRHSLFRPARLLCHVVLRHAWWWAFVGWSQDIDSVTLEANQSVMRCDDGEAGANRAHDSVPSSGKTPRWSLPCCADSLRHHPFDQLLRQPVTNREACLRILLNRLLCECQDVVDITHGEAVEVRLMHLMLRQCDALYPNCACGCVGGGCHVHGGDCVNVHTHTCRDSEAEGEYEDDEDKDENDTMFLLSQTDPMYARSRQRGQPTCVSYAEAVDCVHTLSQIVAWELFALSGSAPQRRGRGGGEGAPHPRGRRNDPAHPSPPPPDVERVHASVPARKSVPSAARLTSRCVALMLPNSVEFNLIWLACARAGTLETILQSLYRSDASPLSLRDGSVDSTHTPRRSYEEEKQQEGMTDLYACTIALMNTNMVSNDMLYHALDCVGCTMILLDPRYAYLLFAVVVSSSTRCDGEVDDDACGVKQGVSARAPSSSSSSVLLHSMENSTCSGRRLRVPPTLRRIFIWRDEESGRCHEGGCRVGSDKGVHATATRDATMLSDDMRAQIRCFNARWEADVTTVPPMVGSAASSTTPRDRTQCNEAASLQVHTHTYPRCYTSSMLDLAAVMQSARDNEGLFRRRRDSAPCRRPQGTASPSLSHRFALNSFDYLTTAILSAPPAGSPHIILLTLLLCVTHRLLLLCLRLPKTSAPTAPCLSRHLPSTHTLPCRLRRTQAALPLPTPPMSN